MDILSLKLEQQWKCLQEGFEWNNIPAFSIITGVNGAGKTHLISLLTNYGNSQPNVHHHPVILKDYQTGENVRLVLPVPNNNLSFDGLINYFDDRENRLGKIANNNQQISTYENRIIPATISQLSSTADVGQKANLKQQLLQQRNIVQQRKSNNEELFVFAYEEELKKIASKVGKSIDVITVVDIKAYANPIFNHLTEIGDFNRYIQEEEAFKNKQRIKYSKEKDFDKISELEDAKKIHEKINELFLKYGFDYFEMKNPYADSDNWNGQLVFIGKKGEEVDYNALSSGEQMIVKFVIWAMGRDMRGDRINAMVLDEPDAHLHPKMCKMMVDILHEISRSKEEGGSNIRIILTTHSPSTIAFAPEESIFVLEKDENGNRSIKHTTAKDAIHVLSEGIFTFDKALNSLQLISESKSKLIVCMEGKTDVLHVRTAMRKLNRPLDIDVIDMHDAGALCNFIKSTPSFLLGDKKIVGVFDNDKEGQDKYNSIKGDELGGYKKISAIQCKGKAFACLLPLTDDNLDKYHPIEYLYSKETLESYSMLVKRNYQNYKSLYKASSPEEDGHLLEDFNEGLSLRPFEVKDNVKNLFAEKLTELPSHQFNGFNPLFDLIEQIMNEGQN